MDEYQVPLAVEGKIAYCTFKYAPKAECNLDSGQRCEYCRDNIMVTCKENCPCWKLVEIH